MSGLSGMKWSSPNYDNDGSTTVNCAQLAKASFWFSSCGGTNPLGEFKAGDTAEGVTWSVNGQAKGVSAITFRVRERLCEQENGLVCSQCKAGGYLCVTENGTQSCCSKPINSCEPALRSGIH